MLKERTSTIYTAVTSLDELTLGEHAKAHQQILLPSSVTIWPQDSIYVIRHKNLRMFLNYCISTSKLFIWIF